MNRDELAARGVRVEALDWDEFAHAATPFGTVRIWTGQNVSYYNGFEFRTGDHLEAAKAAAQADYEARILATLEVMG